MSTTSLDFAGWDRLRRPIWLFDPGSCRGLYANAAALILWGAESREELLARDFSQLSPAVRARTDRLAEATADGSVVSERWTFYPNGEPVTVQAAISAYGLEDGRRVLLFEAAPAEVEADERRAVEALRHTSSVITLLGPDDTALFENPAAFATYGWAQISPLERFADAAAGRALLAEARTGLAAADLCRMNTASGERWHLVDARPATDPVTGAVGVLLNEQDVTAQIEAERALREAEQQAELARARERFLSKVSHEMRTPLNSILGFAELLKTTATEPGQADGLARISDAGAGLLALVNDMILLSELDRGEVALAQDTFDPSDLIAASVEPVRRRAHARGLRVEAVAGPTGRLVGDPARLALVVGRFLDNAVRFASPGAVTVSAGKTPDGRLELAVEDDGPGVDPARIAGLFQRFGQGDGAAGGAGLGLAVCDGLARLMGGEVGVEPALGGGSRFWLRAALPTAAVEAEAEPETDDEAARPLRVLYADDHANNRRLVEAMLATQGHVCDTAEDGTQAVEAFRAGDYDLVLMDIQMPVMDGVEATRAIRALGGAGAATPILALTANTLDDQTRAYAAAGMNDCIAKPVGMVELLTKVAAWGGSDWRRERAAA
jgi:signal transduction histidine kinase